MKDQPRFESKPKKKILLEETSSLKNQLARALADYDNLRKRTEVEREQLIKIANLKLTLKLLTVLDMLYDAQLHLNDSGLAISINEFEDILGSEGIEKIGVKKGDTFDENIHEAVEAIDDSSGRHGKVDKIVLTGWKYEEGPVIRHAKVTVIGGK